MSSYSTVQNHRSMVFDDLRNCYYSEAIKKVIGKKSVVLDLGASLGLHGFKAANYGAHKVYLVEPASIIEIANQIANSNNLRAQVECITGKIEEIDLPEKVDVIISVFTGNFLLSEDLLPSLFYARDKYLKRGGKLIPDRATMEVVPVCSAEYYDKHINCWINSTHDLDLGKVRSFAVNSLYYDEPKNREVEFLAEPIELLELDLMTATEASCQSRINVEITQNGLCHGWLGWFRARLGDKWLSTSPLAKQTHWLQVFLPLAEPISVNKGDNLSFKLNRPEFGEWTWTIGYQGKQQRHSTFLSGPVSTKSIKKKADTYTPQLSHMGQAAKDVLLHIDGNNPTEKIVEYIMTAYQKLFPTRKLADQFVKDLVEQYDS